ncbi:MAG TPA: hypothetical protein VFM18_17170 [Methanosarcina sp.]|nr:hypothetical protein [Methanosarcina sp.]
MKSREEVWSMVRRVQQLWPNHKIPQYHRRQWVEDTYGLNLILNDKGDKLLDWEILDEQKYVLFLLETA